MCTPYGGFFFLWNFLYFIKYGFSDAVREQPLRVGRTRTLMPSPCESRHQGEPLEPGSAAVVISDARLTGTYGRTLHFERRGRVISCDFCRSNRLSEHLTISSCCRRLKLTRQFSISIKIGHFPGIPAVRRDNGVKGCPLIGWIHKEASIRLLVRPPRRRIRPPFTRRKIQTHRCKRKLKIKLTEMKSAYFGFFSAKSFMKATSFSTPS